MRRLFVVAVLVVVIVSPAHADWRVVRWVGPQRCEVLNYKPPFGRWEELGIWRTRGEADRGLDTLTRQRQCRASRLAGLKPEARPK